ncbi:MAG: AAA family ATPase [Planctomycetota bacterium]|nr:AAA family ATPase [Planctomycetota bacterium]MDA1162037.1 AAA family ATPase [Planctomycetota bacterium]
MYSQYWNLESKPFECDSDPAFFFRSRTHQAALLKLRYLIDSNRGAAVLCGNTGVGKTFLLRMFQQELQESDSSFGPFVRVNYPFLTANELVGFLAAELGAEEAVVRNADVGFDTTLRQLEARLAHFAAAGRHPVIILDEAHLIEDQRIFQTIQLLLNYRTDFPFSFLLCGQPTVLSRISRLAELDERIGVKSLIQPFSREETSEYVSHRLAVAGVTENPFDESALDEIHELSGGVPRRINRIADLSLLVGFADGMSTLTTREVESVANEIGLSVDV